jgi:hypothetical protein
MSWTVRGIKKKRRRSKTTGSGIQIGVRWQSADLDTIDTWRKRQEDQPSRAAIRRLVQLALTTRTPKRKAQKASELATRTVERIVDKSMPAEEQERRKRALIKGPKEFRDIREDQPKTKG